MAITDTGLVIGRPSRKPSLVSAIIMRIHRAFRVLVETVDARLRAIEAREKLRRLSDHQLDDIGLSRADIERHFPDTLFRDPSDSLHRFKDMVSK